MSYDRALLRQELIRDEGLRLRTYRCTAGKLTIGVGRNLDGVGIRQQETARLGISRASCISNGITRDQAMALLEADIDACEAALDRKLPWWRRLSPVRQRVILNMCFNMGIGVLLTFRNTLKAMEQGRYADAEAGMERSKWRRQVKARAVRLMEMMRSG